MKQGIITSSYVNYEEVRFAIARNGLYAGLTAQNLPSTTGLPNGVIIDRSPNIEWFLHSYWIDLRDSSGQFVVRIHKISSEHSINLNTSYSSASYAASYTTTTTSTSNVYPFYDGTSQTQTYGSTLVTQSSSSQTSSQTALSRLSYNNSALLPTSTSYPSFTYPSKSP